MGEENNRFVSLNGRRRDNLSLSKIIFYEEYFSLNIKNLLQLQIENVHFVFLSQNQTLFGCLICLKEIEYSQTPTVLILNSVNFECLPGVVIYLDKIDFSLIEFESYNFNINLERINITIQKMGYFQKFLKISGLVPNSYYAFSTRYIGVKNLVFIGEESLSLLRNTLNNNLNISIVSSSFFNAKTFEINVLLSDIQFVDCLFVLNNKNKWLLPNNGAQYYLSISNSNITLENSTLSGDYSVSLQDYIFFIAWEVRASFFNLNVNQININRVSYFTFIFAGVNIHNYDKFLKRDFNSQDRKILLLRIYPLSLFQRE